jgi:predicted DNA-binding transcriptional regulator YafY
MGQTERLYRLKSQLDAGHCLHKAALLVELGISPATLKRDLAHLRDRMNAPLVFDRERNGWRLDAAAQLPGTQYELPGLWLNADEIHALLAMQQLLTHLDAGGLLAPHIAPLEDRLRKMLGRGSSAGAEVSRRIRVMSLAARKLHLPHFEAVATALLRRRRLRIDYHARGRNEARVREVSPQRLVYYRDNWYLDAWCHLRRALRSFAVDAIRAAQVMDKPAIDIGARQLDGALGAGYGIFAGKKLQWADLRFTPGRARWVAAESWHPKQRGRFEADGSYRLRLPYADPTELVMDILRHVPEVEVVGPEGLRALVEEKLRAALARVTG